MNIRGLYKSSLLDFPGKISAVVFTGGCNLRCGYCHNPHLAVNPESLEKIDEEEIIKYLVKRKNLLDSVTISGGEPLLQKRLLSFINRVKEAAGLLVKIDTNGCFPDVLGDIICSGYVDYVAMDMKTSPQKYSKLTGTDFDFQKLMDSLNVLKDSGVEYELRTTCVPDFVTLEDIQSIAERTGRVKNYYLQQYVSSNELISEGFRNIIPYGTKDLEVLKLEVLKFADNCKIRGI